MEKGNLLANTIELLTRFAQRLLQGNILCTMAVVIFLFMTILFYVIFQIYHQKLDALSFAYHSSLLRMCRWIEMYCGRADLGVSC